MEQTHTITIPNKDDNEDDGPSSRVNNKVHYKLRGLTSEDEITNWSIFCQECFQHKKPNPPPADYFARHYYNDPSRDFTLIRVLMTTTTTTNDATIVIPQPSSSSIIASSVRIFKRLLSTGGITQQPLNAGGIGEVCTSPAHRKRGLTTLLLHDAIRVMGTTTTQTQTQTTIGGQQTKEQDTITMPMDCSLLHAGPAFVPVYQKIGNYSCVTSRWSVLTVDMRHLFSPPSSSSTDGNSSSNTNIQLTSRLAQFPNDTPTLQKIHKTYSEDRFVGCIIRSEQYWNEYLSREIGDSLFVLTIIPSPNQDDLTTEEVEEDTTITPDNKDYTVIVAWISIRTRDGQVQLRDFGVDTELSTRNRLSTAYLFSELLKVALETNQLITIEQLRSATESGSVGVDHVDSIKLHLPHPIIEELQTDDCTGDDNWIDWKAGIVSKDDTGWMYKFFPSDNDDDDVPSKVRDMAYLIEHHKKDHLIWPSDSF